MIKEGKWNLNEDVDMMWNEMANCIKRVAKDVLGESKGCGQSQNQEVQATIRLKRQSYSSLLRCRDNVTYDNYKVAKKGVNQVV